MTTHRRRTARGLGAVAVALVALTGCGTAEQTDEVAAGATPAASPSTAPTVAAEHEPFCDALAAVSGHAYDLTASVEPASLEASHTALDEAIAEARANAPEAVDPAALDTWFASATDFADLLAAHEYDPNAVPFDAWSDARIAMDGPAVMRARADVAAVVGDACVFPEA